MAKQIDNIDEVKCPHCGKKIDVEVLVNFFASKK
jgi:endogenous inhibitor of DNA gyrase (YacG/DUF329 family)